MVQWKTRIARTSACCLTALGVLFTPHLAGAAPAPLNNAPKPTTTTTATSSPKTSPTAKLTPITNLSDEFSKISTTATYPDGALFQKWETVFAGYGTVAGTANGYLAMAPARAGTPTDTHAALVVSQASTTAACINVRSRMVTTSQLREGSVPNPWETAWLVWDYIDNEHFTYLAVKTNGWEVGRRDPAYPGGQRFIATGHTPATPVGTWRTVDIARTSTTTTVGINGVRVATYKMPDINERVGKVGMYTEDASVAWDYMRVSSCREGEHLTFS